MKIIAMANQKGGVAKTTSVYNLAWLKAQEGNKVLMIDLDPQATLTIGCGFKAGEVQPSICQMLGGPTQDPYACGYPVKAAGLDNLYLIPSDIELAATELNITGRMARERILAKQLAKFDGAFDYIFIDCPPQLSILTLNALVAATDVIIPTLAQYYSYRGLQSLRSTIDSVREDFNPSLKLDGYIVTMYEKIIRDQRDLLAVLAKDNTVLGTVKKSVDAYRNVLDCRPVVMSMPSSDVTKDYKAIAAKI